eukprot:11188253-Lingulodinium_polyedra.AAC.1
MCSDAHSVGAAPRISQFTHSTRQPPRGGRRMKRRLRNALRGSHTDRARVAHRSHAASTA